MRVRILASILLLSIYLAFPGGALGPWRAQRPVSPNNPALATGLASPPDSRRAGRELAAARFPEEFRTVTGRRNNGANRLWGSAGVVFLRKTAAGYADGRGAPSGEDRPGARDLSNVCLDQAALVSNSMGASSFLWQWGQFLDHDLSLTPVADPAEPFDIAVPAGDPWFDPETTGRAAIPLDRSGYQTIAGVRQQVNTITAYIDASNVYGSDPRRARALRARDRTGRLATSAGGLLPFNEARLPNAPNDTPSFFLAGDFRANEQIALTALHTLFVREHNFWADLFREADPTLSPGRIYKLARAMVGAEMQAITYREFLPLLLGRGALSRYRGYDPAVDAGISNEFATAAFRVGHTMLPPALLRLGPDLRPAAGGKMPLREAFFRRGALTQSGIEPLLRGLYLQPAQEIDARIVDEVRNFLFGQPGAGGFDLASLNIQRGRDHGLPSLNEVRVAYGLEPHADFADLTLDPRQRAVLSDAYGSIDEVDLWVGGLVEPHRPAAMVGETFFAILVDQFERLRDGDRFWYESYLPPDLVRLVERRTLGRIIRSNTEIRDELPLKVFTLPREP